MVIQRLQSPPQSPKTCHPPPLGAFNAGNVSTPTTEGYTGKSNFNYLSYLMIHPFMPLPSINFSEPFLLLDSHDSQSPPPPPPPPPWIILDTY